MAAQRKYLFGPVPSRRLGLSLGVDILPFKTCTQNCVYCQLGSDSVTTMERRPWIPIGEVLDEIRAAVAEGLRADHITISGSGEPTLNSELGKLIDGIKAITDIPVAVITNGTLLNDPAVRADCAKADVVLPSLDAGDEATFQLINKPHESVSLRTLVDGLCAFRSQYAGRIWLEVFIVDGVNTSPEQIARMRQLIGHINPDKVHLNTAVRPTAQKGIPAVTPQRMAEIAGMLGPRAEVIAEFNFASQSSAAGGCEEILAMLRRRPCSIEDIHKGTGISDSDVRKYINQLLKDGLVEPENRNNITFYYVR
jgi:wyosine [tRNA(Phe)-imidazoG37] synthetase (radical SAM superfamily)